jgi:hypothetical protein
LIVVVVDSLVEVVDELVVVEEQGGRWWWHGGPLWPPQHHAPATAGVAPTVPAVMSAAISSLVGERMRTSSSAGEPTEAISRSPG